MRKWLLIILPVFALAFWTCWPEATDATLETNSKAANAAEAKTRTGVPLRSKTSSKSLDTNATGSRSPATATVPLAVLGSKACWDDCGAPCAAIDEAGFPVCSAVCGNDEECNDGERCLPTATTAVDVYRTQRCQKSHCDTDEDCRSGWSCLAIAHRTVINICNQAGNRSAGEPCLGDEYDPIGLCDKGLLCVYGVCTEIRGCDIDSDCALGTRCAFASNGSFCSPGCNDDERCPNGTECLALEPGAEKLCLDRDNFGCTFGGCEAPLECVAYNDSDAARITACQLPCENQSDCQASEVCGSQATLGEKTHCYPRCETSKCDEGWLCTTNAIVANGEDVLACYRDTVTEMREFFESLETSEAN